MKTFLTICTCAMVTAGIYGFADMAGDVKNGTMISYEGEEEFIDVSSGALAVSIKNNEQAEEKIVSETKTETKTEIKQQSKIKAKARKEIEKKDEPVIEEKIIQPVVEEKFQQDIVMDSMPAVVEESFHIDYEEFSRGAPRKHKNKKHKKD